MYYQNRALTYLNCLRLIYSLVGKGFTEPPFNKVKKVTFFQQKNTVTYKLQKEYRLKRRNFLTIISRARMGYESIAHEGERNNCFSKILLVGQKYQDKTTLASKTRFRRHCFWFSKPALFATSGLYDIQPSSSSTNQNAALIIDHQFLLYYLTSKNFKCFM